MRVGFAAGDVVDNLGPCDASPLDAEATAIIAMTEFAFTLCQIPRVSIFFHFGAMAVGFGAFGISNIPQAEGSMSSRQRDARVLLTILERRLERGDGSVSGLHCMCSQGTPVE